MSRAKTGSARAAYCGLQLKALAKADIRSQAEAMGLEMDDTGTKARARFLGRDYLIDNQGVTDPSGKAVMTDTVSVLSHYMISKGRGEISGEFVPIGRLTGISAGASSGTSPSDQLFKPLAEKFGADYESFRKAALALGAKHVGLSLAGAQSFLFDSLPKLHVKAEFFEADDEFDAEIKVLFSSNATTFVMYEILELTIICLVVSLLLAAGLITDTDELESSFI
jgi:hypothetical protein